MVLVPRNQVARSFSKTLLFNIILSDTVQDNMTVNITDSIMTIRMSADNHLMTRKTILCKLHSQFVSMFHSQSVFCLVIRIEADNIVVCLNFIEACILSIDSVYCSTLSAIGIR